MDRRPWNTWEATWRYVTMAFVAVAMAYWPFVRHTRVPLLGYADLGIHELGHLLTYVFPDMVTAFMGSGLQVMVPLGLAAYFFVWKRDNAATGLMLAWTGTNLADVAVYLGDAPYQRLPLIGGSHDWAFLLGPRGWDVLEQAGSIASALHYTGLGILVLGVLLALTLPASRALRAVPRRRRSLDLPSSSLVRPARKPPAGTP